MKNAYDVLKRPMMTEKNTYHMEDNIYVFEVDRQANKLDIRAAVEKYFRVKVASVKTAVGRGKSRRTKFGMTSVKYYKKAFVKLAEGEKIALFEGA